ncbi:hypothetical protein [Reyranella sp.]|uniref:hypothetical protein n=1 Tax=Reyranella sp. TaxID=1929291 RepID=UPI002600E74C|nr:hypothetical protein [Reyranella sp.]
MIWPFKKKHVPMPKQTIPEPLSAARLFKKTLSEQMPNGRAQIVIALWHTPIHLSVFRRALTEEGNHEEFRIEHMLPVLEDQLQRATGDIAPRRLGWLTLPECSTIFATREQMSLQPCKTSSQTSSSCWPIRCTSSQTLSSTT